MNAKRAAAVVAICCGAGAGAYRGVSYYEGERLVAYRDASPRQIWTVCYGETKGVKQGDRATKDECRAKLANRVEGDFVPGVEHCIHREMPIKVEAAFVDMAYNMGIAGFCSSGVAKRWNAGDERGACEAMRRYVMSGTRVLNGLVKRRGDTADLCLEGLL